MRAIAILVVLGACAALPAQAQDDAQRMRSPFEDHFRIDAGMLSVSTTTELRVDPDAGVPGSGTEISAEDDFGLRSRSEMGDVEVMLRIRERHHVRFNYFRLDRRASEVIDETFQFGNDTLLPGDLVDSRLDLHDLAFTYSYTILSKPTWELYGSFSLHLLEVQADAEVDARDISESEHETAPAPALGVGAAWRFSNHIHAEGRAEYLFGNASDKEVHFLDIRASCVYRFNPALGVGLAYVYSNREAQSNSVGDSGSFTFRNQGPELFLRATF
jgi:hypothetical protein